MMNAVAENDLLQKITRHYRRSPLQLNRIHESDAEVVRTSTGSELAIAITTDSIVEEISSGLYSNPYVIGWMTVIANMSDLAATGAHPLGMLISEALPSHASPAMLEELHRGIQDACTSCGTYVLGGDTNFSDHLILTGCAVGLTDPSKRLTRLGCQPGDLLYSTGPLGLGNAFALSQFCRELSLNISYQPCARLKEGRSLWSIAHACMDSSDGVIATLDQLMRLNNVGFALNKEWPSFLHPEALRASRLAGLPEWLFLAGHHGEFELLFTIPRENQRTLIDAARAADWTPLYMGTAIDKAVLRMPLRKKQVDLDTGRIRNLAYQIKADAASYIAELLSIDNEIQKGA